jgi:hypothetical protein
LFLLPKNKILWLLPFWFFTLFSQQIKAQILSEQSKISVLTCGPGVDLYSVFGHSAIRVHDPMAKIDYVFNYGTFDFGAPGFYKNFLLGYLEYYLSVSNFNQFLQAYKIENRGVEEQILRLSQEQKQAVFDFLKNNYLPENRAYRYDFIKDNCATKELELLKNTLGDLIQFSDSLYKPTHYSYRDLILQSLAAKPWIKTGINLILGSYMDQKISPDQASFLPKYLSSALDLGMIKYDVHLLPLVDQKIIHFQPNELPSTSKWLGYLPFLMFLAISGLLYGIARENRHSNLGSKILYTYFSLSAFIGTLLFFLGYFTEHYVMANNINLLWINPLYMLLPIFKKSKHSSLFINFLLLLNLLLLVLGTQLFQPIDLSFAPLVVLNCLLLVELKKRSLPSHE